jgi:lipopolysaccharide export system protein LptA
MTLDFLDFLATRRYLRLMVATALSGAILTVPQIAQAQASPPVQINSTSNVLESNAKTGVFTLRGNVQINIPARKIQATATQVQHYSREQLLIMTGNVYVLQDGNSLRAEEITYLIKEGRFIAKPQNDRQVESTYIITEPKN